MKVSTRSIFFWLLASAASACPFCSEGLSQNSGAMGGGGFSIGFSVTIFFMLGMTGSVVGFIIYQILQTDKNREARLAQQREAEAVSAMVPPARS